MATAGLVENGWVLMSVWSSTGRQPPSVFAGINILNPMRLCSRQGALGARD